MSTRHTRPSCARLDVDCPRCVGNSHRQLSPKPVGTVCCAVLCRLLPPRPRNRHYSLATYILLRGITLLIRVGNKERNRRRHPALHALLAPTRIQHGDTILMCAACESWACRQAWKQLACRFGQGCERCTHVRTADGHMHSSPLVLLVLLVLRPVVYWWTAGSQIIYAFIMMPHTLPQSYVRWIRKQGAKELYVWQGVRVGATGHQAAAVRRTYNQEC